MHATTKPVTIFVSHDGQKFWWADEKDLEANVSGGGYTNFEKIRQAAMRRYPGKTLAFSMV